MNQLKKNMQKYMQKNEVLHCILKVLKNRKNDRFLKSVLEAAPGPKILVLEEECLKIRQEKAYLLIDFQQKDIGSRGFCAILRYILAGCCFADNIGLIPHINIEGSLYNVPGGWNGYNNMYNYYFQGSEDTVEEVKNKNNVIKFRTRNLDVVYNSFREHGIKVDGYSVTESYLREMGNVMKKYVRLKKELEVSFEKAISEMFMNRKVLGVHIRGTDFNAGLEKHPIAVSVKDYFEHMECALQNGYDAVFVATDDKSILKACKEKYGDKILYYKDTYRSENGVALHMKKGERKDNQYYLGWELLRDMYTLASCEGLISGLSQVSFCTQILKYAKEEEYQLVKMLDKGINVQRDQEKLNVYKEKLRKEGIKGNF